MLDSNKTAEYRKNNYEERIRTFSNNLNDMIDKNLIYILESLLKEPEVKISAN